MAGSVLLEHGEGWTVDFERKSCGQWLEGGFFRHWGVEPCSYHLGLLAGGLLLFVAMYLPFIQTHYAVENRFGAIFELGRIRELFRHAPIAFWTALLITLLFSLPLYLLKIEFPPKEIAWLPSLFFVAFIFPARILTGWAMGRALKRERYRHFLFRWLARFGIVPIVGFYVLMVYLTQYL